MFPKCGGIVAFFAVAALFLVGPIWARQNEASRDGKTQSAGESSEARVAVEQAAVHIAEVAKKHHCYKVLVTDLIGPAGATNELGRALADEISVAIGKANEELLMLPRRGGSATRQTRLSKKGAEDAGAESIEADAVQTLARAATAEMVISGTLTANPATDSSSTTSAAGGSGAAGAVTAGSGDVELSLRIWDTPPVAGKDVDYSHAEDLEDIALKIPMTAESEALMEKPLGAAPAGVFRLTAGLGRAQRIPSGAACLDCPPPWNVGEDATVKMLVTVNNLGRVTNVQLTETSNPKVVKTVVETVRRWRFQPAKGADGLPTETQVPVTVKTRPH